MLLCGGGHRGRSGAPTRRFIEGCGQMILILDPNVERESVQFARLIEFLEGLEGIEYRAHQVQGAEQLLTEIYLIGRTSSLALDDMLRLPGVARAVRVSEPYRVLGRHK